MARLLAVVFVAAFLIACKDRKGETLQEASMNFDAANVRPFLIRLVPHIESGFGEAEISRVEQLIRSMKVKETRALEFPIRFRTQATVLRVQVFLDDSDAPDLYFFTVPGLASVISEEMEKFANERGL